MFEDQFCSSWTGLKLKTVFIAGVSWVKQTIREALGRLIEYIDTQQVIRETGNTGENS